jgi:hypothetical protein
LDNIIALGETACNIAQKFAEYPQYEIYMLDSKLHEGSTRSFYIPEYETHEEYEDKCPNLEGFFESLTGTCLFIVNGTETISGASLSILRALKGHDISILYIRPDLTFESEVSIMQNRVVYHVLQEYVASFVFSRMYIVDNVRASEAIGDVPIKYYYDEINKLIVSTMHMINVFDHMDSEIDTFTKPFEANRFCTFGIVDLEQNEEKLLFNLTGAREKRYYYAINQESLETDGQLLKKLTQQIKSLTRENTKASYGVFGTDYPQNYGYTLLFSNEVQEAL